MVKFCLPSMIEMKTNENQSKYKDNNCSRVSYIFIRVFTIHFVSRNLPALFLWQSRSQFVCRPLDDSDQYRCQHQPLSRPRLCPCQTSGVWGLVTTLTMVRSRGPGITESGAGIGQTRPMQHSYWLNHGLSD